MYVKDLQEALKGCKAGDDLIVTKVNGIPVRWEKFKGDGASVYKVKHIEIAVDGLRVEISGGTGSRTQGYRRWDAASKLNRKSNCRDKERKD